MRWVAFFTLYLAVFMQLKGGFKTAINKPLRFSMLDTWGHAPINIEVCQYIGDGLGEVKKEARGDKGETAVLYTDDSDETGAVQGEAYDPLVHAIQREYH